MPALQSLLGRVKARDQAAASARLGLGLLLRLWKLLRLLPASDQARITLPVEGPGLRVRLFSYDDLLCASPAYEARLRDYLPAAGAVAVDAGAYIGRHTLAFARAVGRSGRVLAFEPLAENFELLAENVRRNGHSQVQCFPVALGRDEGVARLYHGRERSTATSEAKRAQTAGLRRQTVVRRRRLDDVLCELGIATIDFLKIDVEGAELDVLIGAESVLERGRATIVIEQHGTPHDPCPIRVWLGDHGFDCEELIDGQRRFYVAAKR